MAVPLDTGPGNVICPIVVGRAAALEALQRALTAARGGRGQALAIAGEAGIGKSRLLAEAKTRAAVAGWTILEGQCFETDRALPYAPVLDLLRTLLAGRTAAAARDLLGPAAPALRALLPDLLIPLTDGGTANTPPTLAPEQEKRRLFNALCQLINRLAAARPVLLVMEDLHWSDETSLEFLLYCARQIAARPVLLLLTYRDDEVGPELEHLLAGLERQRLVSELRLSRLTPADVDAMLRAIFALRRPVRGDYLDALYMLTEGNPFFVEEILRALVAAGEIHGDDGWDSRPLNALQAPRSVQDAVRRRSQQLSPRARHVLTLAAVAGHRFQFPLLKELTGCSEAELLALIREWLAAQLVVEESSEQFAFRHALIQRALYTALLARERRALHGEIAAASERVYAAALEAHLPDLAYHSYEAGAWEQALLYSRQVGERAQAMHSPRAAVEQFTRAIDAARQLGGAADAALYRARGQAYGILGEFERAHADHEYALTLARAAGDRQAEWQALMDLGFLWAGREYARTGAYFREASERAQRIADPTVRAHSLNRLGNWLINTGQAAEGLAAHHEALALFATRQDRRGMAETHDLLGMANGIYGAVVAGVQHYDRAIALLRELDDVALLSSSLASHAIYASPGHADTTAAALGTPEAARRANTEALALARRLDWLAGQAYAEFTASHACAAFGEFGAALRHGHESLRLAAEIAHQQWMAAARQALGQTYVAMALPAPAIAHLEAGLPLARELGSAWWVGNIASSLAFAYLLAQQPDRAEAVLLAVFPHAQAPRIAPERRLLLAWGELALQRGDPEAALLLVERLLRTAPGAPTAQPIPALLKLQGEALAELARLDEAAAAFAAAVQGAEQRGDRPRLWRIRQSLAGLYERRDNLEAAQAARAAAQQTVQALAATIDDPALREQFVAATGAAPPEERASRSRRPTAAGAGGLTAREREIAALVAQGHSNRVIADTLVIGERTVETHISNILFKLGVGARTQIAAWAVAQGLTSSSSSPLSG